VEGLSRSHRLDGNAYDITDNRKYAPMQSMGARKKDLDSIFGNMYEIKKRNIEKIAIQVGTTWFVIILMLVFNHDFFNLLNILFI